jgi:hypothetical protein
MWKNVVGPDRPQMKIWCVRIVRWITKATNTHAERVILNGFATAAVVERTRLDVTLQVHCTSCCY